MSGFGSRAGECLAGGIQHCFKFAFVEGGWHRTLHKHDRTDVNDPQFDVYQDVQSQNHNSTMQLLVMGYSGDVLCAKFIPEKVWERQAASAPVTVENTRKQQETLARTSTAGGVFFLTGGQHLTADDGWIASEMKELT